MSNNPTTTNPPQPPTYDVFVTTGNPAPQELMQQVRHMTEHPDVPIPNTITTGTGRWQDYEEHSAFILWTDVTNPTAERIKAHVHRTAWSFSQDAVGLLILPAGSALLDTTTRPEIAA